MKSRKWVLVVAGIISVLFFGWYGAWRTIKANDKIRVLILERMKPFLASSSSIGGLEVGIRSIQLRDVVLVPRDSAYTLEVKDIRIGYNLLKLITYRFAPNKVANELVMEHPVITIREGMRSKQKIDDKSAIMFSSNKLAGELETIKRIAITDAKIIIENKEGRRLVLGHSLEGYLRTERADSSCLRLTGGIFSSKKNNLHIEGVVDLIKAVPLDVHIKLDKLSPRGNLDLILPPYLSITKGSVEGELFFGKRTEARGFVVVKDSDIAFKGMNLVYSGINLKGNLSGDSLFVKGNINSFNGSEVKINGSVSNVFSPVWDLTVSCPGFDIPAFFREAVPGSRYGIKGRGSYNLKLSGSLFNPEIKGYLHSSDLAIYGIGLKNYAMAIGMKDSVLTLEGTGSRGDDISFGLAGKIDFSDSAYSSALSLSVKGSLLPVINPVVRSRLKACGGTIDVRVNGELENLKGHLEGRIATLSTEGDTLLIFPSLSYSHDSLGVVISSNSTFGLKGYIQRPFRNGATWNLSSVNVTDLLYPMVPSIFKRIIKPLHIGLNFKGNDNKWAITAQGKSIERSRHTTFFTLNVDPLDWKNEKSCRVSSVIYDMTGKPMSAGFQAGFLNNSLSVRRLKIGKNFSGNAVIPFSSQDSISAHLISKNIDPAGLKKYFSDPPSLSGLISSALDVSGTAEKPTVKFALDFKKGFMNQIGPLDGMLSANWAGGKFIRLDANLNRRTKRILFGSVFRTSSDSLSGNFKTDTLYIKEISTALFKNNSYKGLMLMNLNVAGRPVMPVVSGDIEILDGKAGPLLFKKLNASFRDTLNTGRSISNSGFYITRGEVERSDNCRIQFSGRIPHAHSGKLDLKVSASGNVLGMLSDISGIVKKSRGTGSLFLRFAGTSGNWVLGSAKVNIDNGELKLSSLFTSIKDIRINAELKPGERFLSINEISGLVDRSPVLIRNIRDNNKLPRLRISKLGVDMGNFILRTEKPVRMALPGLMEKGAEGRILFTGFDFNDFMIGGPSSYPSLNGTLQLVDFRFTYPLLKSDEAGEDEFVKILSKINWNINVVPRKDVHYTRDIKTALGNVFADLKLRDGSGGVRIKGTIDKDNFEVWGNVSSTEGSLEVLEHFFRPEQITFDMPRKTHEPIFSGRAFTTVTDSLGMPATVWLSVAVRDRETGIEKSGGLWENIHFKFSTDNPNLGRTEADLMAALGYSADNIKARAYDALGTQVENLIFRPIFRPIERGIRRHLGLDVVRFSSMFTRNLFQMRTMSTPQFDAKYLLRSTRWTLGKYIGPGIFITYTGQVQNESYYHGYMTHGIGFRHALSLEFTLRPDIFLEFEYTYDSQLLSDRREDKKIWIRHIFPF